MALEALRLGSLDSKYRAFDVRNLTYDDSLYNARYWSRSFPVMLA
jgi:hypothetical protein